MNADNGFPAVPLNLGNHMFNVVNWVIQIVIDGEEKARFTFHMQEFSIVGMIDF